MYQKIIETVEAALKTLGVTIEGTKVADGRYNISKNNNIHVQIDVWQQEHLVFFQVLSHVTKINNNNKCEVLQMLLEENHIMVEASFAISGEDIFIKDTIDCSAFFDENRVLSTINRIGFYCEAYKTRWQVAV
ncbi:MAG: hypothetical protein JSU07_03065 [Bacteroidetes bacterium]|nr:hypothetical protein [Bacteroidota bacterium]